MEKHAKIGSNTYPIPEVMLNPKIGMQTCLLRESFLGPLFYEEHLGEVGRVPPTTKRFVEMAQDNLAMLIAKWLYRKKFKNRKKNNRIVGYTRSG